VDSLLWRTPAHHLRTEDGAGQRGAGLQVSLEIYIQKEVGRNKDGGGRDPSRREQTRKREVMSSMSIVTKPYYNTPVPKLFAKLGKNREIR
jgi:hypothetical protein